MFGRLGLERRQREVESLSTYLERKARELPEEAEEAVVEVGGYPTAGQEDEGTTELPGGNGRHRSEDGAAP